MFKSLRWRLQVWHAVVLLIVLTSFGGVVYGLHWRTRLQKVDEELDLVTHMVRSQFHRLLPPRRRQRDLQDASKTDTEAATRSDQVAANRSDSTVELRNDQPTASAQIPQQATQEQPSKEQTSLEPAPQDESAREEPVKAQGSREPASREQPARERRDPGPTPPSFEEMFHGEEESRFYYIIWGREGKLLHKSDSAPSIDYPGLHADRDELPINLGRDRKADHIYRELITCIPLSSRQSSRTTTQAPQTPNDFNVLVGRSIEKEITAQHHSGLRLIVVGFIILSAGFLGGGWVTTRAVQPIISMTATAEAISAQNLSERIDVKETDSELGKLATVLNASFDRLEEAVERQRQFTADASHELRTPLSVIAAHTELALSRPRSNEDYQETIETCLSASQRMKALIDSLLLLARFDSGAPALNRYRMDLNPLVRECAELVEPLATARGIRIECQTTSCPVFGDWDRLSQVITNLLTNAIRYNVDGGSIDVTTQIESATAVISVADTGVGIAQDQLPRIFDRFYQVDKARSRAEGSCGLGLSICQTIVQAHGGTITAASQVSVGTTLQVRLPIADKSPPSGNRQSNERRLVSSSMES